MGIRAPARADVSGLFLPRFDPANGTEVLAAPVALAMSLAEVHALFVEAQHLSLQLG